MRSALVSYPLWFGGTDDPFGELSRSAHTPASSDGYETLPATPGVSVPPGDAELIVRIRTGDTRAFERLFHDLHLPLVRFARTCGISDPDADDIVIDVFAAVWDVRHTWTPATSIAAYFFRATRNRARNALRDRGTELRYVDAAARDTAAPLMGTPSEAPDRAAEMAERTMSLWSAIERLPERARVLLTLRWRDALSIDEIAAVLELTPGSVKTGLTRATHALRNLLPADFR
jgi:RNA polymerase sigma-70 factor (ECF subfamily)